MRRRAFTAASEVLPLGQLVWLLMCRFGEERAPELPHRTFKLVGRFTHRMLEEDAPCFAWAEQVIWPHPGDFDTLIDSIARDDERAVWISPATEVFAPYDGGVDLILATRERATAMRKRFPSDWFSPRSDGL